MPVPVEAVARRKDVLVELYHRYHGRMQQLLRHLHVRVGQLEDPVWWDRERERGQEILVSAKVQIVILVPILCKRISSSC